MKECNAWAHMKDSFLPEDIERENEERQKLLRNCMQALNFLAEYPIRHVQTVNHLRSGEWRFECLCYRGDHPGLPQEEIQVRGDVPEGDLMRDLFLDTGTGRWVSLYPFVSSWNCAACKWRETYYVDNWKSRDNTVELKSFERGHLMSRPQMSARLQEWSNRVRPGG